MEKDSNFTLFDIEKIGILFLSERIEIRIWNNYFLNVIFIYQKLKFGIVIAIIAE